MNQLTILFGRSPHMKIMIMRHSDALSKKEADVVHDADRPLSSLGKIRASRLGEYLTRNGIAPKTIVCSPFVRTQECARTVRERLPMGTAAPLPLIGLAPGCDVDDVLRAAQNYAESDDEWILAILHEPDVSHALGNLLFDGGRCPLSVLPGDLFAINVNCDYDKTTAELLTFVAATAIYADDGGNL